MRNILRLIALLLFIWLLGFIYFIYSIQTEVDEPKIKADAVVVLTGGSNRLAIGFEILNKKLAKRMFISGVANNVKIYELKTTRTLFSFFKFRKIIKKNLNTNYEKTILFSNQNFANVILYFFTFNLRDKLKLIQVYFDNTGQYLA